MSLRGHVAIVLLATFAPFVASAQSFFINNIDGFDEGFNDPTPRPSDIDGQPTTLGQDRLDCFASALQVWADFLKIDVTVVVDAEFDPLGGTGSQAYAGFAKPLDFVLNFMGTPIPNIFFTAAQSNQLAGIDLTGRSEMQARFNSDIDGTVVLGNTTWYYGIDGNTPGDKIDFFTTALHEVGHGLGFITAMNLFNGTLLEGYMDIYTKQLRQAGFVNTDYSAMNDFERLAANLSGQVVWKGVSVNAEQGALQPIFAPNPIVGVSSISHWDTTATPNLLMEPAFVEPFTQLTLEKWAFADLLWPLRAPLWTTPVALNNDADTDGIQGDYHPQLTTDGAGTWIAVWNSKLFLGGRDDIFYAVSTDTGITWSEPAALNNNAGADTNYNVSPQITTDGAGTWIAVWNSGNRVGGNGCFCVTDHDILYTVSTDAGTTWSEPAPLNSNYANEDVEDERPQLTTDGAGTWIAVWDSRLYIAGGYDILYAKSTDAGTTWSEMAALNSNAYIDSGYDRSPQLTTDGAGTWIAVWYSGESFGGIGSDEDILYAVSTDTGTTWSASAALNSNAPTDTIWDGYPQLTTDGAGTWIAVWNSGYSLDDILGKDTDILYAVSTDAGTTWSASAALNSNAYIDSGYDRYPQLTTDGAGTWIAVWDSGESFGGTIGDDYDILYAVLILMSASAVEVMEVWVDFNWSTLEYGTVDNPFNTLNEGVNSVSDGGTIHIRAGESPETLTITKAVRLEAHDGPAIIGQALTKSVSRSGFISHD